MIKRILKKISTVLAILAVILLILIVGIFRMVVLVVALPLLMIILLVTFKIPKNFREFVELYDDFVGIKEYTRMKPKDYINDIKEIVNEWNRG